MVFSKRRIDLHLPKSWNACTKEELEQVARIIKDRVDGTTVYNPFSMDDVKIALFFVFSKIQILEPVNPRVKVEDQYYMVRLQDDRSLWKRLLQKDDRYEPFQLYLWQIRYWIDEELKWLDDEKSEGLLLFPYEAISRKKHGQWWKPWKKSFAGPQVLMQDFSWQRYRFASDYLALYSRQQNNLLYMQKHPRQYSPTDILKQIKNVDLAKAMFLATLFNGKVHYMDADTRKTVCGYQYTSNQHSDNAEYFRDFPDDKFQVVLFWWEGMMHYLQKKYPRCFAVQKSGKKEAEKNPLELYVRMVATMEKYLSMDEDEVNRQTYHIVLQHMEDMARENEELEKIRNK